jgi:hypothetical protein
MCLLWRSDFVGGLLLPEVSPTLKGGVRVRFPVDFECWLALVRSGITRDETASGSHQKFG